MRALSNIEEDGDTKSNLGQVGGLRVGRMDKLKLSAENNDNFSGDEGIIEPKSKIEHSGSSKVIEISKLLGARNILGQKTNLSVPAIEIQSKSEIIDIDGQKNYEGGLNKNVEGILDGENMTSNTGKSDSFLKSKNKSRDNLRQCCPLEVKNVDSDNSDVTSVIDDVTEAESESLCSRVKPVFNPALTEDLNCQIQHKVKLNIQKDNLPMQSLVSNISSGNKLNNCHTRTKLTAQDIKSDMGRKTGHKGIDSNEPEEINCQTRPQPKQIVNDSKLSELELMFKRIKDRKSSLKVNNNKIKDSPKSRINSPKKLIKSSELKSPSIKSVLKSNKKDKSIKKKEPNRVRKLIMDLEKPRSIQKTQSVKIVAGKPNKLGLKKLSMINHNQAKITSYLGSKSNDEAVENNLDQSN